MSQVESKTQVDRLGERLRRGDTSEVDLRLLDQYRRSFGDAYEIVISTIRDRLGAKPSGRAAKSTAAITDKLRGRPFGLVSYRMWRGAGWSSRTSWRKINWLSSSDRFSPRRDSLIVG